MKIFLSLLLILYSSTSFAIENINLTKGKNFFEKKDFEQARIEFEKSIVYNPKNIDSYIYLSKIFSEVKNEQEEKKNIKTALLLDPKNEEALLLMIKLNIKEGDYSVAEENYKILSSICIKLCNELNEINLIIKKFKG
jgi:Tfp pilus assembly protein PilF